jgi:tripartite-type tricarboxylate transporter receptor subunit TctC
MGMEANETVEVESDASWRGAPVWRRREALLSMALAVAAPVSLVRAESGKPIRLVVPFTPGGTTDILARVLAPRMQQSLGQSVIIDNRPGAGGSLGADLVARAEADGLTLLMGHIGTLAVNVSLYPKLPYDPLKSFAPVAWVARVPNVLVVNAASGITSLKELIARAKANPGKLTYSSGGNGSAAHITFEVLKLRAGIFMSHIPYRGTAPSVTDLLGGQVDATFTGAPAVLPHVRSGRLRALAVSSPARIAALPEVPTVAESGYPGFEADQWYGIVAPAGTPADVVARLNATINKALASPEVAQQLATEGALPMQTTPKAFADLIAAEIPRWREVVRAGNVKPD